MRELPDRWRELGEFIREQRGMARLSLRRLSDLAGISNPYLSQIERGLRKPSAEILQQIAHALRLSAETLYERAGLLDLSDGGTDTITAIQRDRTLSEDAKQTLIKVYQSLRSPTDEPVETPGPAAGTGPVDAESAPGGPPPAPATSGPPPAPATSGRPRPPQARRDEESPGAG